MATVPVNITLVGDYQDSVSPYATTYSRTTKLDIPINDELRVRFTLYNYVTPGTTWDKRVKLTGSNVDIYIGMGGSSRPATCYFKDNMYGMYISNVTLVNSYTTGVPIITARLHYFSGGTYIDFVNDVTLNGMVPVLVSQSNPISGGGGGDVETRLAQLERYLQWGVPGLSMPLQHNAADAGDEQQKLLSLVQTNVTDKETDKAQYISPCFYQKRSVVSSYVPRPPVSILPVDKYNG